VVGGTGATGDAFLFNGVVMYIGITTEGTGYTNPPSIFIAPPDWSQSLPLAITNIGGTLTLALANQSHGLQITIHHRSGFTGLEHQSPDASHRQRPEHSDQSHFRHTAILPAQP